ncbi:MAG: DUF5666 domain-containing protein [Rhodospirillales bacterium]|nr:DUF5666 domain-containing protein [Rhodospirillales bacterium]
MLRRAVWLGLLLGLAACQARPPAGAVALGCRATRPVTDRGIGGTGAVADRGIGGTGMVADRGIGGTGIVGAITGFASVCVDGVEVAIAPGTAVTIDGTAAATADLRVGQVIATTTTNDAAGLRTGRIAAFHQVSGPVWTATPDRLVVAGQTVRLDAGTLGPRNLAPGAWVAVSGLLDLSGTIRATRIDARAPGDVVVTGRPVLLGGVWRIGTLQLRFGALPRPAAGRPVQLHGRLAGTRLVVTGIGPEPGQPRPGVAARLLREGFAATEDGRLRLGDGVEAPLAPGFGPPPPRDAATVVEFVDTPNEGLVATHWHAAPMPGGGSGHPSVTGTPGNGEGAGGSGEGAGGSGEGGASGGGEGSGASSSSGEGAGSGGSGHSGSGHGGEGGGGGGGGGGK